MVTPLRPGALPKVSFLSAVENSRNEMGWLMEFKGGCCLISSRIVKSTFVVLLYTLFRNLLSISMFSLLLDARVDFSL